MSFPSSLPSSTVRSPPPTAAASGPGSDGAPEQLLHISDYEIVGLLRLQRLMSVYILQSGL
jgi:hypothetical protein